MRKGETVGATKLRNFYDAHFASVLTEYIQRAESTGKKHERKSYKIIKDLPSRNDYNALKVKRYTTTVGTLVDDAKSIAEELGGEMRDWYDNLTDTLQQMEKGERVNETADALENLNWPDVPDSCSGIEAVFYPALDTGSRAKRASEAADMLNTAVAALRETIDNIEEAEENKKSIEDADESEESTEEQPDKDECDTLANELEEVASELESLEFPGMYS